MSETFFTVPPHWGWLIIGYFFIGGIAGGGNFIAALLDLFGTSRDRPVARLGHYVALVGIVISGVLLTVDLTLPERFWHMLIQAKTGWPMFKWWSPMSIGAWGITLFGLFAFVSVLGALAEEGWVRRPLLQRLRQGALGAMIAVIGGILGFFVAGYTGVLLSVTNRPLWADTDLLGLLFLFSAASTAATALILLGLWRGAAPSVVHWLPQLDSGALVLELLALVALLGSLGAVARLWLSWWGVVLAVGVVVVGILLPLLLHWRPRLLGRHSLPVGAGLVLVGGFLLWMVVVFCSEAV